MPVVQPILMYCTRMALIALVEHVKPQRILSAPVWCLKNSPKSSRQLKKVTFGGWGFDRWKTKRGLLNNSGSAEAKSVSTQLRICKRVSSVVISGFKVPTTSQCKELLTRTLGKLRRASICLVDPVFNRFRTEDFHFSVQHSHPFYLVN